MAQATADFELGTQGSTIATSDAGSANAWNGVSAPPAGGSITYDNTHAYGTRAAKLAIGGTAGTTNLSWLSATLGTITAAYGRIYIYATANPGNENFECYFRSSGTVKAQIRLSTTGKILLVDAVNVTAFTSSNSIALNQWVRLEWHIVHSTTVGHMECLIFNSPDSVTPTETLGDMTTNLNLGANSNEAFFGTVTSQSNWTHWLDNIVWGATSYPGPYSVANSKTGTGIIGP